MAHFYFEKRIVPEDYFFKQIDYFSRDEIQPKTVIFGDSRVAFGLGNRFLAPEIYNFSQPGENLFQTLAKFTYILKNKPSVKTIIIALDDHVLSQYRANQKHKTYQKLVNFVDKEDLSRIFGLSEMAYWKAKAKLIFPMLSAENRFKVSSSLFQEAKGNKTSQRIYLDKCYDFRRREYTSWLSLDSAQRNSKAKTETDRKYGGQVVTKSLLTAAKQLINLADHHGIKVIALRTPETIEFKKFSHENISRKLKSNNAKLILEYNALRDELTTLDFRSIFDQNQHLFTDPDHINYAGVEVFTSEFLKLLKDEISVGNHDNSSASCLGG